MKLANLLISVAIANPVVDSNNSTDVETGEKTIGAWFGNNYILEMMMRNEEKDSRAAGLTEKLGEHPSTLCIDNDQIDYETCKEHAGSMWWSVCYQACADDRDICVGSVTRAVTKRSCHHSLCNPTVPGHYEFKQYVKRILIISLLLKVQS